MTRREHGVYRLGGPLLGGVAAVVSIVLLLNAGGGGGRWSAASTLDSCASGGTPRIAFPASSPADRTGDGALVWLRGPRCPGGAGVRFAAIDGHDRFAREQTLSSGAAGSGHGAVELTGAEDGRVLLATPGTLREGTAGSWRSAALGPAGPVALARAYRGQTLALYALPVAGATALIARRGPLGSSVPRTVARAPGPLETLATAMDYRTAAIAAWCSAGMLYARSLPGVQLPAQPVQRLGECGRRPSLAALVSDDGRAIVAWIAREAGRTRVFAVISQPGIRFGAPSLLTSYADPRATPPPDGALRLVRLSSGRVLIAWPGVADGRYVVRLAHVSVTGVQRALTLSRSAGDALLDDLVPGPRGDWLALWSQPRGGAPALYAAYGGLTPAGSPVHGAPEEVAGDVGPGSAQVAFDPDSDRAIAAWRTAAGALASASRDAGGR